MELNVKLHKGFVAEINSLKEKYGEKICKLNGFHNSNLNFGDFIDNFVNTTTLADATIDSNANNSMKDVSSMIREMSKPHQKLLSYNKIYYEIIKMYGQNTANEWLEEEWNGGFYLHNAHTSTYYPYCFAYSLEDIATKGLFFLGKFKPEPAKHLDTFNHHVLEFMSYVTNRTSGACGLADYIIYSFFFFKQDKENNHLGITDWDKYKKQQFQAFIYNINQPYLRITESSFSNISLYDREYLVALFGDKTFPDGSYMIDYLEDIIQYQKDFMEVCSQVRSETMFTFPVLTFALLFQNEKFVDEEFARWANKHNMKWYDSNFYLGEDVSTLSSCCRVLNNFKEMEENQKLKGFVNSIGGTSLKVGSVQVNTTNLMRIALESEKDETKYFEILQRKTELSLKVLHVIRNIIKRNIEKGLLPIYDYKLIEMERQFNTLGVTSMFNAIQYMDGISKDDFGNSYYNEKGIKLSSKILEEINRVKDEFKCDYSINVENVPGENANKILCKKDIVLYGFDKIQSNMYANQWIALTERCTNNEKIKLGSLLDRKCGGGQILHVNLESGFANEEQSWKMLNLIAKEGVIYFAYNIKISACDDNHAFIGETCHCGKPATETYSRIVGFLVPYSSFSKERKEEFDNRIWQEVSPYDM